MSIQKIENWKRPGGNAFDKARSSVLSMLEDVKRNGDRAIRQFSLELDGFEPGWIPLKPFDSYPLAEEERRHLKIAADRIRNFSIQQRKSISDMEFQDDFGSYGHRHVPLSSAGCYIPGGRFPLVSSALMTLIPAEVAGVPRRIAISPSKHPAVLAAASLAGATSFLHLGGAQAIMALAFGFQDLEKVNMICGPGNAYVNAAKELVMSKVKIDSIAGPSEILILADSKTRPEILVEDLLAQAEHDPMALSVCASTEFSVLQRIETELNKQNQQVIGDCHLLYANNLEELISFSNDFAPEHLVSNYPEAELDPERLCQYGSLFLGEWSAVAMGDYCAGPNHTLPTAGNAQIRGGLYVGDFLKTMTWQKLKPGSSYSALAQTAISLAEMEGLIHHKRSLETRLCE